jgi:hypothetical protein
MAEIISLGPRRRITGHLELRLSTWRLPDGNTLITDGRDEAGVDSGEIEVYPEISTCLQIYFFEALEVGRLRTLRSRLSDKS